MNTSEKLRSMADALEQEIMDKFSKREVDTHRKLRLAESAAKQGVVLNMAQSAMRCIASYINTDMLPDDHKYLTTKSGIIHAIETNDPNVQKYIEDDTREMPKSLRIHLDMGELIQRGYKDLFPTPDNVLDELMMYAAINPEARVLEPSAGLGHMATWVEENFLAEVDCIEVQPELARLLSERGFKVVHNDFLTFTTDEPYDNVVMNPPFSRDEWVDHMMKAWEVTRTDGVIYAILPTSAKTKNSKKIQPFRDLMDAHGQFFPLPQNSFGKAIRKTGVSTLICVLYKDVEDNPMPESVENTDPSGQPDAVLQLSLI